MSGVMESRHALRSSMDGGWSTLCIFSPAASARETGLSESKTRAHLLIQQHSMTHFTQVILLWVKPSPIGSDTLPKARDASHAETQQRRVELQSIVVVIMQYSVKNYSQRCLNEVWAAQVQGAPCPRVNCQSECSTAVFEI